MINILLEFFLELKRLRKLYILVKEELFLIWELIVLPLNIALYNYKSSSKNYHNHYVSYMTGGVFLGDFWAIEREVRLCQRLINHLLWRTDEIHTKDSLARFFRCQDDVELRLDRLVDLDILQKAESGTYTVSKNQMVHEAIKRINERDRTARSLVDSVLSHFF